MESRCDLRWDLPNDVSLKDLFSTPDGLEFKKVVRDVVNKSIIDCLNHPGSQSLLRSLIDKNFKSLGFETKKKSNYDKLQKDDRALLAVKLSLK